MKFMKFSWFVLEYGLLGKETLIIGAPSQIGGDLNASVSGTNVSTFATSTSGSCVTSIAVGSMTGAL